MADIARRREAALTSGVVPWNRLPTSFKRVHSAKRSSSQDCESPRPTVTRHPTPKLQLQPENGVRGRVGPSKAYPDPQQVSRKSIVVTLPFDSGAVRPKTANFPARNFLAGYRQIPSRGSVRMDAGDGESERLSRSSSILMLSPSVGNGPGARQDLDQMDDAELNQIFEELAAVDDEETARQTEKTRAPKGRVGIHPEATEMREGLEIPTAASLPPPDTFSTSSHDFPAEFGGGRCTPTYYRAMPASRLSGAGQLDAGQLVHSQDNLVYVPRPKTRLCRVYVGSTVTRASSRGRALEFLPVNRQACLHNRGAAKSRPTSGVAGRPIQYSTNFSCSYGPRAASGFAFPFTHPGTPEPDCFMCQHYLQR